MYVPEAFREEDPRALHAVMRENAFGLLVGTDGGAPFATHLPFHLEPSRGAHGTLYGHVARNNPHWRSFDGTREVLAIFTGPHAYVSPRWYATPRQVPSWNYLSVHAWGVPRIVDDAARVHVLLRGLSETYENGRADPWSLDELPVPVLDGLARGIVVFELEIARLAGKAKLSQNKSPIDRRGVIDGLRKAGDTASVTVAGLMEKSLG